MDYLQALQNSLSELEENKSGSGSDTGIYSSITQTLQNAQNTLAAADVISDVTGQFAGSNINSLGNTISNTINSIGQAAGSIVNDIDPYKYKNADEADYVTELAALRLTSTDIDDLFTKRDSAIDDYTNILNTEPDSTELLRIYKNRLDVLNSYIERLAVGYVKQQEREETVKDTYYNDLETEVPLSGDQLQTYANSSFNDLACSLASYGIPIVSDFINGYCVPTGPTTTDCNVSTMTNFNETCSDLYTDGDSDNLPQHLTWGQIETSQYDCAVGLLGGLSDEIAVTSGRQERGVCGLGYFIGSDDTINMTQCRIQTDTLGEFNQNCANEVGGGVLTPADISYNLDIPNGPADITFGKSADSEACTAPTDLAGVYIGTHAKCGVGYFNGVQAPVNSSHCLIGSDTDISEGRTADTANDACRRQVGFEQGEISIDQPSQHTYGAKSVYDTDTYGCWGDYRRVQCEMGYSAGVELEPWSTECVYRTDNMGDTCKNTYGDEWFPWPSKNSSWNVGCYFPDTKTRATCMTDDKVPVGTEFTNMAYEVDGQQCTTAGTYGLINPDYACSADYGPNYTFTEYTQDVSVSYGTPSDSNNQDIDYTDYTADDDKCTVGYRGKCQKTRNISDFKNSICLWTNQACGGYSCKERCESAGKGWVALNENKNCNSLEGGENSGCICCTVNNYDDNGTIINKTDEYLQEDNPYHAALLDTAGKISGKDAGVDETFFVNSVYGTVGSNDLFLCKHAAFTDNHYNERECTNLTNDLSEALPDPGHNVYTPYNSDMSLMGSHLNTYQNIAGEGPSQAWLPDSSNYTWTDHYGEKWCTDYSTSTPEFHSCVDTENNAPSGWEKASDGTTDLGRGTTYSWNKPSNTNQNNNTNNTTTSTTTGECVGTDGLSITNANCKNNYPDVSNKDACNSDLWCKWED